MSPFPDAMGPPIDASKLKKLADEASLIAGDAITDMHGQLQGGHQAALAILGECLKAMERDLKAKLNQARRFLARGMKSMGFQDENGKPQLPADLQASPVSSVLAVMPRPEIAVPANPPIGQITCVTYPGMPLEDCLALNPNRPECCIPSPPQPPEPPYPPPPPPEPPQPPPPEPPLPPYPPPPEPPPDDEKCCPAQVINVQCGDTDKKKPTLGTCCEPTPCRNEDGSESEEPPPEDCEEDQGPPICPKLEACMELEIQTIAPFPLSKDGQEHPFSPCGYSHILSAFGKVESAGECVAAGDPAGLTRRAFAKVGNAGEEPSGTWFPSQSS